MTRRPPRRSLRAAALGAALLLVAGGCASSPGSSWTFSPPAPTTPAASPSGSVGASGSPGASPSATATGASPSASAASPSAGAGNVVELTASDSLEFQRDGQKVTAIQVQQGQSYTFRVSNPSTALDHNFYIGSEEQLAGNRTAEMTGVPAFRDGTMDVQFTFSGDAPLKFGCTVVGHYQFMQGDFQVQP